MLFRLPASQIAEFIGWGGPKLYAQALDDIVEEVPKVAAKSATRTIFANLDDGMTSVASPAVRDTADDLAALLDVQRDHLLAGSGHILTDRRYHRTLGHLTKALSVIVVDE